jgi:hypothetical protein
MKITNMVSNRSNREVANQFDIMDDNDNNFFQSYNTIIAKITKSGKVYLDKNAWNYSATTSKYRNQFLGETTKETEAKIKSGEYELINLN